MMTKSTLLHMPMGKRGATCFAGLVCWVVMVDATSEDPCDPNGGTAEACASTPIVQTVHGPVAGFLRTDTTTSQVSVGTFWGLPFAEPPVQRNRFRAPQKLARQWKETWKAVNRSAVCFSLTQMSVAVQDEDCLYLNLYVPAAALGSPAKLPVIVWLVGGAYVAGSSYDQAYNTPQYDGAALAGRHNVIVVVGNYRLSGLDFFASDALRGEDEDGSTGNMGVRDQRAALEWVQANIASFGGDPTKVTLAGESAGGFSVMWHLVSRRSWPLFQQAIMQSGTSSISWFFQPYHGHAREFYAQWSEKIGCPRAGKEQLKCLRRADAADVMKPPEGITVGSPLYYPKMQTLSFPCGPVIDGAVVGLEDVPLSLVQQGRFNKVPLMVGSNKDDGTIFNLFIQKMLAENQPGLLTADRFQTNLKWFFSSPELATIGARYSDNEFTGLPGIVDYTTKFSRMIRDGIFACPSRALAAAWAKTGVPTWLYSFSFDFGPWSLGGGDLHGVEIAFLFRNLGVVESLTHAPHAHEMIDIMSCKWTTFLHTGKPNGPGPKDLASNCEGIHEKYLSWPQYEMSSQQYYSLKFPPAVSQIRLANKYPDDEFPNLLKCGMWEAQTFPWHGAHTGKNATERLVLV